MTQKITTKIAIFQRKEIRKTLYWNEWWFSIFDVCDVLTESIDAGAYWRKLKQRLTKEGSEVVTFCHSLKLMALDGKMRETDCANTESIFRIIQSIPSPKAEPFKRWLEKVGYERVVAIENNERRTNSPISSPKKRDVKLMTESCSMMDGRLVWRGWWRKLEILTNDRRPTINDGGLGKNF